jgi:hypothetical protein
VDSNAKRTRDPAETPAAHPAESGRELATPDAERTRDPAETPVAHPGDRGASLRPTAPDEPETRRKVWFVQA